MKDIEQEIRDIKELCKKLFAYTKASREASHGTYGMYEDEVEASRELADKLEQEIPLMLGSK